MNNYFINVTKTLNLKHDPSGGGTLLEVINTYKDHKSITNIKTSTENRRKSFSFRQVDTNEIVEIIKSLDEKKGSISNCIPVKLLKNSSDVYITYLKEIINDSIAKGQKLSRALTFAFFAFFGRFRESLCLWKF